MEQKYLTLKAVIQKVFEETKYIALTSDILTITNSTRSFLVITAHFISQKDIEAISFSAVRLYQVILRIIIEVIFPKLALKF